ncbi:hypothetical protein [Campylobacter troglodytis]|nr:hypothetical protein [Campylobacter troglodytis]
MKYFLLSLSSPPFARSLYLEAKNPLTFSSSKLHVKANLHFYSQRI